MNSIWASLILCGGVGVLVSLGLSAWLHRVYGSSRVLGRASDFHHQAGSASIPRLGGICIVGGFLAAGVCAALCVPAGPLGSIRFWTLLGVALAMFGVGLVDDLRALGARKKLLLQVTLAAVAWAAGIRIEQFKAPFVHELVPLGFLGFFVTVFWLVAMTNLINLIDGIDGLAGGIGVLLMALLAWVGWRLEGGFYALLCVGALGGLLGFLRFNFPPARIYMGDGGAYFIGFFIGLVSIETSNKGTVVAALAAPVLAMAVPILDTSLTLLRRASKGLPLFRADQDHIHHRLLALMGDKRQVLMVLYAISAIATSYSLAIYMHQGRYLGMLSGVGAMVVVWVLQSLRAVPRFRSAWPILRSHWRLRRHTRRVLKVAHLLEREAGAGARLEHSWARFERFAPKLGLDRVGVKVGDKVFLWQREGFVPSPADWYSRRSWVGASRMEVEMGCGRDWMGEDEFTHVAALVAEAWHKVVVGCGANEADASIAAGPPKDILGSWVAD
jgi:UDP-GlcNAc:undecaprenyl-phosphate GlcNAc-1-phosphate transferase